MDNLSSNENLSINDIEEILAKTMKAVANLTKTNHTLHKTIETLVGAVEMLHKKNQLQDDKIKNLELMLGDFLNSFENELFENGGFVVVPQDHEHDPEFDYPNLFTGEDDKYNVN